MSFIDMFKYGGEKLIATIPVCFLTFSIEDMEIIAGIVFIVILDTFLGLYVGIHFRRFRSPIMRRLINKVGQYGIAMASVWVLAAINPSYFDWAFHGMGIFIILTELLSNFEKLALLGMKLPTKLVSKLNKEYEKLMDDKIDAEDIMERRDNMP